MKLTSVRALKQEIREQVSSTIVEERVYSARRLAAPIRRTVKRNIAAFGIAPTRRRRDFALAVRVFTGAEAEANRLLRRLGVERLHGSGELDLVTGVKYRPRAVTIEPGTSCGHYQITAGTLGGFVEDDENYYLLSNNHVLANCDAGFQDDPILQPGPADIKNGFDVIGLLNHWVPLSSAGTVDAAVARIEADYFYPQRYKGIGVMGDEPVQDRYTVRDVVKKGRTTSVSYGRVTAFELDDITIDYGTRAKPRPVTFDDQLEFVGHPDPKVPFSQPGDSGSFILDAKTLKPYALLYGGGPDYNGIDRTLGQFMPDVLDSLGVWLVQ